MNSVGAMNLALLENKLNAQLIHISTDYVFDVYNRQPYVEEDPIGPLSAYGRGKAEGETTWYDFAVERKRLGRSYGILASDCRVEPISSARYGAKAPRLAYSVLYTDRAKAAGLRCRPWMSR